jgi:hypothetical protein
MLRNHHRRLEFIPFPDVQLFLPFPFTAKADELKLLAVKTWLLSMLECLPPMFSCLNAH